VSFPPSDQNEFDLSIYRKRINCHSRRTFNCKDVKNLISVPNIIRHELFINYKFLAQYNTRMCSKHVGITNFSHLSNKWWVLVTRSECWRAENSQWSHVWILSTIIKKNNDKLEFNIDKIDSM